MEPFDGLEFGLNPREPHAIYRASCAPRAWRPRAAAGEEHADALEAAERTTGVSSLDGHPPRRDRMWRNTGSSPLVYRLARLAMANEPRTSPPTWSGWRVKIRRLSSRAR
jgi:hypothetical protein